MHTLQSILAIRKYTCLLNSITFFITLQLNNNNKKKKNNSSNCKAAGHPGGIFFNKNHSGRLDDAIAIIYIDTSETWLEAIISQFRGQHHLQKFSEHNHAAEASHVNVVKTIKVLKDQVQQTNDQPVQIIQNIVTNSSQEIFPYLPLRDALRQSIKRI
ncbi:hypothetical protein C1646_767566 [Rhizophagus diaphanus]|nr:hypothetical protein C1646_767566 [Rhizophagus diaphanus] [Rhizophagus sp. MUCL 43196]